MKKIFVLLILSFFLVNFTAAFATDETKEETQKRIDALEKQVTELKKLIEERNKTVPVSKSAMAKETPQPIAPVRPALKAYISQEIARGPHVLVIKNASKYIWGCFEINGRPVIFVRNGFPNTYPTNQGIVTLLPPGEVAYLILDNIGPTLIKAKSYTGVATPLQFQKERTKTYDFNARAEPYQRSIWSRWDF